MVLPVKIGVVYGSPETRKSRAIHQRICNFLVAYCRTSAIPVFLLRGVLSPMGGSCDLPSHNRPLHPPRQSGPSDDGLAGGLRTPIDFLFIHRRHSALLNYNPTVHKHRVHTLSGR